MPNRRVVLQPAIEIVAAQSQDIRFAVHTGGAKSGLVWLNVLKSSSAASTWDILGATGQNLSSSTGSQSYWITSRQIPVGASTVGAFKGSLTDIPDFLRWSVTGVNAALQFEIVLYLYDT